MLAWKVNRVDSDMRILSPEQHFEQFAVGMSRETYRGSLQPQDSPGLGANRRPAFWTCAGDVPGEVVRPDAARAVGFASCMFARPGQDMARSSFPPEWAWRDSNPRPSDYESPALTTELQALGS